MAAESSKDDGVNQLQGYSAFVFDNLYQEHQPSLVDQSTLPILPWFSQDISQPDDLSINAGTGQGDDYDRRGIKTRSQTFPSFFPSQNLPLQHQVSTESASGSRLNEDHSSSVDAWYDWQRTLGTGYPHIEHCQPNLRPNNQNQKGTVAGSADPSIHKRKNRCLKCRLDGSNRGCSQYPLCRRCICEAQDEPDSQGLLKGSFLDWKQLFSLCVDLRGKLDRFPETVIEARCADPELFLVKEPVSESRVADSITKIILEFSFSHREIETLHLVVLSPREQDEMRNTTTEPAGVSYRAPVINQTQLDQFVKAGVWGISLWDSHEDDRFDTEEKELWSKVRMFIGYLSLMHNLANTSIQSGGYMPEELLKRTAVEFIYTLVWRLQMLWVEIRGTCATLITENNIVQRPVVIFYALEILYQLVFTMRQSDWDLPEQSSVHPLLAVQHDLNRRVASALSGILAFECFASGIHHTGRKLNRLPSLLTFARLSKTTSFPSHCLVTIYQSRSLSSLMPLSSDTSSQRRLVDVLGSATNSANYELPMRHVDGQNAAHDAQSPFRTSNETHTLSDNERPIKKVKMNDDRPDIVATAPVVEDGDSVDLETVRACRGSVASSGGGTPVLSLTHSTPASIPSPVTPLDILEE